MIVNNGLFYLYRHIRLDTNSVFYVGIGGKSKADIKNNSYSRATLRIKRNDFWNRVVAKTDYSVDILLESNDRNFIEQKEIEFIKIYGRRDKKEGELTNLNDGGNLGLNHSDVTKAKRMATLKNNGGYDLMVERIKKFCLVHNTGTNCNKKVYLYSLNGLFIKEFHSRTSCKEFLNVSPQTLLTKIKSKKSLNGYYITNYFTEQLNISLFKETAQRERKIIKICPKSFAVIEEYPSLVEADIKNKTYNGGIWHSIHLFKRCMGFYWSYKENSLEYINQLKINHERSIC